MQRGRATRRRERMLDRVALRERLLEGGDLAGPASASRSRAARARPATPPRPSSGTAIGQRSAVRAGGHDSNSGAGAAGLDLGLVRLRQAISRASPSSRSMLGVEADLRLGALRRADAVAHQRRLAARRVIDRLVRAGQVRAASRRAPSARCASRCRHCRTDRRFGPHRAKIRARAILDRDEIEGLASRRRGSSGPRRDRSRRASS